MQRTRTADLAVILSGQSLCGYVDDPLIPELEEALGFPVPVYRGWKDGYAWAQVSALAQTWTDDYATAARTVGVVQIGGTTDYSFNQTGPATYNAEVNHSTIVRGFGVDWVIGTTTTPSTTFTGPQNTNRQNGNALVLADASDAFAGTVDLAGDPRLDDAADTTYYLDGTHPTTLGAQVMAELIAPVVAAVHAATMEAAA